MMKLLPGSFAGSIMTSALSPDLLAKRDRLMEILRGFGRVVVAFSGAIDSTVVARAAHEALGDREGFRSGSLNELVSLEKKKLFASGSDA
jgi:uncharacterized protein